MRRLAVFPADMTVGESRRAGVALSPDHGMNSSVIRGILEPIALFATIETWVEAVVDRWLRTIDVWLVEYVAVPTVTVYPRSGLPPFIDGGCQAIVAPPSEGTTETFCGTLGPLCAIKEPERPGLVPARF
jgi:hypothetical protein